MKLLPKRKAPKRWPEGAIVYQIYPRSFYDSNNDGIGDIPGIIKKLGYLKELGVNVIWLSPFYPSPMADFGYDVADYCDVDPIFGKLADMDILIKAAHRKHIKVLVDLVPNHTSDEHEWFRQSRQSKENQYSNWYIWRDAKGHDKNGQPIPPNNWLDMFSGNSAWEWEPKRQQFYMHSFDVHQPDLNWTNPEVREAIKTAMRFWLNKGVDGFRVDAVRHMGKEPTHKDNPVNPHYDPKTHPKFHAFKHIHSQGWPHLFAYLAEMSAVLKEDAYHKSLRFMVSESYPQTPEPISEYLEFYEGVNPEVAAPFIFEGLSLPWEAGPWRKFLSGFHKAIEELSPLCVASYAFGNHDQSRLATRMGDPVARSAALMLLTLPGLVFIYNGEEIGMLNGEIPPDMVQDPSAAGGEGGVGRDPERTPMQWSASEGGGFTTSRSPWLPLSASYKERNVEVERKDPDSYLQLYKKLCHLRGRSEALRTGSIKVIETSNSDVLGYVRSSGKENFVVLINFSDKSAEVKLGAEIKPWRLVLSSLPKAGHRKIKGAALELRPKEAVILKSK